MSNFQSRSILFTYFTEDDFPIYVKRIEEHADFKNIKYICMQLERSPTTGRNHIQGFACFSRSWRIGRIRRMFGSDCHVENRRGTVEQAKQYCSKEETRIAGPYEHGEPPQQGRRNDLDEVKCRIEEGATDLEIAEEYFSKWVVYRRSFAAYRGLLARKRDFKTRVVVLWGAAGTGKSRTPYDIFGHTAVYDVPRPNGGSVWFDGFESNECTLLDDFYGWIPFHLLLKLGDRYPLQLPRKGGFVEFNSKFLIITSNISWERWYDWEKIGVELKNAFRRRIDLCVEFGPDGPIGDSFPEDAEITEVLTRLIRNLEIEE